MVTINMDVNRKDFLIFQTFFLNYFDDDLSNIFGKDKEVWIEKLKALQKKKYKHLKLSSKQLESQLVSVYGTKSVFSF